MLEHGTAAEDGPRLERYRVLDQLHVEGETLRALQQRAIAAGESIPQALVLRIALDLIDAMQALARSKERGGEGSGVHGALTLDAVHVGADGRTRLLDPVATAAAARAQKSARNPVRAAYTAPEHIEGGGDFDVRSDVFSLGVLLWETLACRSLFGAPTYAEVRGHVLRSPIPRVQRERFLRGEPIAAALANVVARALQRDAERRFQSYAELADAVRAAGLVAPREEVAALVRDALREAAESLSPAFPDAVTRETPMPARTGPEPTAKCELPLVDTVRPPAPEAPAVSSADAAVEHAEVELALPSFAPTLDDTAFASSTRERGRWSPARAVAAALALVLLVAVGWLALRPGAQAEPTSSPAQSEPARAEPVAAPTTLAEPAAPPVAVPAAPVRPPARQAADQPAPAATAAKPVAKPKAVRTRPRAAVFVPDDI
jgi:serine/threonine-protein kinase